MHIDGDAFFASCEIALNPKLRGRPVITGSERGIASSLSYEAKRQGVKRGMMISDIKKVCPTAIILPSDYETYSLFSQRMFNIVRRYTSAVEEYSIDECFADLTGLRRPLKMSYPQIAKKIKADLQNELGMTFSIGLAPTKVLAKVASKWQKPDGLTIIYGKTIDKYLLKWPVAKIWGIGHNTSELLKKYHITTSLDFIMRDEHWIKAHLTKPFHEIWQELRGIPIYDISSEEKETYQSISKTKTFTPPSTDPNFVFAQLSKNVENACIKVRRHGLAAKTVFFFLKTQEFNFHGWEIKLHEPTTIPSDILTVIKPHFEKLWRQNLRYRATGVILSKLAQPNVGQLDLFGQTAKNEAMVMVYKNIDELDAKYGKHTVFLGSSLTALTAKAPGERNIKTKRQAPNFKGETERQHLAIPLLGLVN